MPHLRTPIVHLEQSTELASIREHPKVASKKAYQSELAELQLAMLRIQQAWYHTSHRGILVLEGWDAAGKGGALRRLTEKLDPRGVRVHPIGAPLGDEQGKHYLWRFWQRLPTPGRLAVFDRSWYGRVLVERVEGFAKAKAWKRAFDEINEFEHTLIDDGVRVVKIFLHITPSEQLRRFEERLQNPYKRWKLTTEDIRNRERWSDYVEAIDDMLQRTSTQAAPWTVIAANHKWHARLEVLRRCVATFGDGIDATQPRFDPELIKIARNALGIEVSV